MNVYIMGAGAFGEWVYKQLAPYQQKWHILGYIDSDIRKKSNKKNGLKIYHLSELKKDTVDLNAVVLIAITNKDAKVALAYQLNEIGFSKIYVIRNYTFFDNKKIIDLSEFDSKCVRKYEVGEDGRVLPIFTYLETHVMNGCNLKCKGCSHFSNLFSTYDTVEFEQYARDMKRLSELCNITFLRLLGGEPFLNGRLLEYLEIAREAFPYADLRVATNGLLIPQCKNTILEYISDNNILLDITMYKPTEAVKDKIIKCLDHYDILYNLSENISEFNKVLALHGDKDPVHSINSCTRKKCLILKAGKLYRCPISAYICNFNEQYGTDIESKELFDIYMDSIGSLRKIALENPVKPISTCKYCVENPVNFAWEQSLEPKREEWLIGE